MLEVSGSIVPKAEAVVLKTSIGSAFDGIFSNIFCNGLGISLNIESFSIKLSNSSVVGSLS